MKSHDLVFDLIAALSDAALESDLPKLAWSLEDSLDVLLEETSIPSAPPVVFQSTRKTKPNWYQLTYTSGPYVLAHKHTCMF